MMLDEKPGMTIKSKANHSPSSRWRHVPDLVVLALWVMVFTALLASGKYKTYLVPGFWPFLVLALLLTAVCFVTKFSLRESPNHDKDRRATVIRICMLILPLPYLACSYGETLGAFAFSKRATFNFSGALNLPPGAFGKTFRDQDSKEALLERNLLELYWNAAWLSDQQVVTMGQVTWDDQVPEGCFVLFRFVINCCMADGQPLAVLVRYENQENLKKETWVEVKGKLTMNEVGGDQAIMIHAESVRVVKKPENIYLYVF